MKKIEKLLLETCAFTVAILVAFFALSSAFKVETYLNFTNLLVCILIGAAITVSCLIFKIKNLQIWFKIPLHYASLLIVYIPFVYISIPTFMEEKNSSLFVAIVIYTVFYFISSLVTFGIKKLVAFLDSKVEKVEKKDTPTSIGFKTSSKKSSKNHK